MHFLLKLQQVEQAAVMLQIDQNVRVLLSFQPLVLRVELDRVRLAHEILQLLVRCANSVLDLHLATRGSAGGSRLGATGILLLAAFGCGLRLPLGLVCIGGIVVSTKRKRKSAKTLNRKNTRKCFSRNLRNCGFLLH